ncbi:MAG TPA: VanZ family protein [Solirubrobacterales bacterium]|nr:VanZ family protein [Solirubrobacterales bacterium]
MRDSTPTSPLRLASLLLPPLVLMAVIFYLSAQPSAAQYPDWEVALRKLGHAGGYAVLAFAWWRAFRGLLPTSRRFAAIVAAVVVSLAYAASDEFHQSLVTSRHGTPIDVLIDSIGIAAAAMLAVRLSRPPAPG